MIGVVTSVMPADGDAADARQIAYLLTLFVSSLLFIFGLRGLTSPPTARRGMMLAAAGMAIAVAGTLLHRRIVTYEWILGGMVVGTVIGIPMGLWIPMTKMPERIALSHSFGGLAVALVGVAEYFNHRHELSPFSMGAVGFEVILGAITFTGSLMAFGKLQGILPGRPQTFPGQNALNFALIGLTLAALGVLVVMMQRIPPFVFCGIAGLGCLLGVLLVVPIGGADMPVVICLLNSYAGLAAAATGFALNNPVLIVCGSLDGGSGFILAVIMSRAMNRSFRNVLFGAFGARVQTAAASAKGAVREGTVEDAAELFRAAGSIIVVPGYGMAVAQAQHALRDLAGLLERKGTLVRYAVHPVAGRMPGHMNVLLAEANVSYERIFDLEAINDEFQRTDVALVVGANDVVNPAARSTPDSPIYGMPILNADRARAVIVLKRSMSPGFAGIDNGLFVLPNTIMVFGDARQTLTKISACIKEEG